MSVVPPPWPVYPAGGSEGPAWADRLNDWAVEIDRRLRGMCSVMEPRFAGGAKGDSTGNDSPAFQAAIDTTHAAGGGYVWVPEGVYRCTTTITMKSNVTLIGPFAGALIWALGQQKGATILWAGAINSTVISVIDTQHAIIRGVGIDGGGISGVTGIWINSDNDPMTWYVVVEDFYIQRCGNGSNGYGIRLGDVAQLGVTSPQLDKITIRNGEIASCWVGISSESDNSANGGLIDKVTFVYTNIGIQIYASGANLIIQRCIQGGPVGANPTFIFFRKRWNGMVLIANQTEGFIPGASSVRIDADPRTIAPITFLSNGFALADSVNGWVMDIRTLCHLVSIGNDYWGWNRLMTAGTKVSAMGDSFPNNTGWNKVAGSMVGPAAIKGMATQAWTPGTIAAGANATVSLSLAASAGDFARAGFTPMQAGLDITASVLGTNAVQVYLTNKTAAPITVGAGTLTVEVDAVQ